jgi:hypothetical protein
MAGEKLDKSIADEVIRRLRPQVVKMWQNGVFKDDAVRVVGGPHAYEVVDSVYREMGKRGKPAGRVEHREEEDD